MNILLGPYNYSTVTSILAESCGLSERKIGTLSVPRTFCYINGLVMQEYRLAEIRKVKEEIGRPSAIDVLRLGSDKLMDALHDTFKI